jgi:hypothetical protein
MATKTPFALKGRSGDSYLEKKRCTDGKEKGTSWIIYIHDVHFPFPASRAGDREPPQRG